MKEIWKDVKGYEGLYQVSNVGRVKSLPKEWVTGINNAKRKHNGLILRLNTNGRGYYVVGLYKDGKEAKRTVHQLVAIAFLDHAPSGMELVVNHINFNRTDNRVENLEIVTQRENANKKHLKSTSQYVGVYESRALWRSEIRIHGKKVHIGSYNSEHAAGKARQVALEHLDLYDGDNKKFRELIKSKL